MIKVEQVGIHGVKDLKTLRIEEGKTTDRSSLIEELMDRNYLFFFVYVKDDVVAYMKIKINGMIDQLYVKKISQDKNYKLLLLRKADEVKNGN